MSYEKTNWATGDIVTAEKLNNLESGVEDAQLPAYTSSDIGKVLGLTQATETVTVIPEQTVTVTQGVQFYYATLNGVTIDWANAKAGDTINIYFGDDLGRLSVAAYDSGTFGAPAFIATNGGVPTMAVALTDPSTGLVQLLTTSAGTYHVYATAPIVNATPDWVEKSGWLAVVDFSDYPARTETVGGHAYNSGTDDLYLSLYDGDLSVTLRAGNYAFVSDLSAVPDYFAVKMGIEGTRELYIPYRFEEMTTDAINDYAESGFCVSSESNIILVAVGETHQMYFAFIESSATVEYGTDAT